MAKINAGITGGISGKINDVIGYRRKGKSILTGVPVAQRHIASISLINNSDAYKQCKEKINLHYRQIFNALTTIGQQNRLNISELITLSPMFKNYNLPYFSGTFYIPYDGYTFNGIPSGAYNSSTQAQSVTLAKVSKYYNVIQERKFMSFRSFSPAGGALININLNSGNNVSSGGVITPFPIGTRVLNGLSMIDAFNQSKGDILLSIATRF